MNTTTKSIAILLAAAAPVAAGQPTTTAGAFAPGEKYAAPDAHAPAETSRMHVRTVTLDNGRAVLDLPVNGGSRLLVWTMALSPDSKGARVVPSLTSPSGKTAVVEARASEGAGRLEFAAPDLGLATSGTNEVVYVERPEAGNYRLELAAADGAEAVTVAIAEPDSALTMSTWIGPLSRQPGERVYLNASLRDGDAPLTGARVTARLAPPNGVAGRDVHLHDDGAHNDGAANDGLYGATLRGLPGKAAGLWTARFEASGRDARGSAFARTGGSGLMNESGAARLESRSVAVRSTARGLSVSGVARVAVAGQYRFEVTVAGPAGADGARPALAWAEQNVKLDPGTHQLNLTVPATSIASFGSQRLHVDVRLLGVDPMGVAGRVTVDVD